MALYKGSRGVEPKTTLNINPPRGQSGIWPQDRHISSRVPWPLVYHHWKDIFDRIVGRFWSDFLGKIAKKPNIEQI